MTECYTCELVAPRLADQPEDRRGPQIMKYLGVPEEERASFTLLCLFASLFLCIESREKARMSRPVAGEEWLALASSLIKEVYHVSVRQGERVGSD